MTDFSAMEVDDLLEESSDSSDSHISSISVPSNSPLLDDKEMIPLMEQWQGILNDCLKNMKDQYWYLKEMLKQEESKKVTQKLEELKCGKEKELLELQAKLRTNYDTKLEKISRELEYRLLAIKHKYDAEDQAIQQTFEERKKNLYETIKRGLEEKIRLLEQDINKEVFVNENVRTPTGIKAEPLVVNKPYVVYMISDDEIKRDHAIIRKAVADAASKKSLVSVRPIEY